MVCEVVGTAAFQAAVSLPGESGGGYEEVGLKACEQHRAPDVQRHESAEARAAGDDTQHVKSLNI